MVNKTDECDACGLRWDLLLLNTCDYLWSTSMRASASLRIKGKKANKQTYIEERGEWMDLLEQIDGPVYTHTHTNTNGDRMTIKGSKGLIQIARCTTTTVRRVEYGWNVLQSGFAQTKRRDFLLSPLSLSHLLRVFFGFLCVFSGLIFCCYWYCALIHCRYIAKLTSTIERI